jgi:nicotinamide riboside kinase
MRISIVGSHSTGKTTLLRALSERLDVPALSEVAREKIAESETLPHLMTPEERGIFQMDVFREQVRRESGAERFISDRSAFDAAAYAFDTPDFETIFLAAEEHFRNRPYSRIFFLPIEFSLEGDGVRNEDEAYRKKVEDVLVGALERAGADYVRISGEHEARLAACIESIR